MSTRIRYSKTSELGVLQSTKMFVHPTNGARFKVLLNTASMEYSIIDDVVDVIAASGRSNNLNGLKAAAKQTLEQLGISFEKEERTTRLEESTSLSA